MTPTFGGLFQVASACLTWSVATQERPVLQELTRHLAGELFADVGWGTTASRQAADGETPRQARLRARLITLLGILGADGQVRSEARRRLADADAGRAPLPPDLATAIAQVVAASGAKRSGTPSTPITRTPPRLRTR